MKQVRALLSVPVLLMLAPGVATAVGPVGPVGPSDANGAIEVSRQLSIPTTTVAVVATGTVATTTVTARVIPTFPPDAPAGPPIKMASVHLEAVLVIDPDFPELEAPLVRRALEKAAVTFGERFNVPPPTLRVLDRMSSQAFLDMHVDPEDPLCQSLLSVRYKGGDVDSIVAHRARAIRFLKKWKLADLQVFLTSEQRETAKDHAAVYDVAMARYAKTVDRLMNAKTPRGTPLIDPANSIDRSFAAWTCALGRQRDYDVIVTNTFLLADVLTEPHPHAVFGKGKVGGVAAPNGHRSALGRQALLASTFGIDTDLAFLSELGGQAASLDERAAILGDYLLAHEIAHAVFGIPDFFDHPATCLMTSRPGETYREGLAVLGAHPGPCSRCRSWVEARGALELGARLIEEGKPRTALKVLANTSRKTPRHFHGGYRKRMSAISVQVSRAYELMGRTRRAKRYARRAWKLDKRSTDARNQLEHLGLVVTSTIP